MEGCVRFDYDTIGRVLTNASSWVFGLSRYVLRGQSQRGGTYLPVDRFASDCKVAMVKLYDRKHAITTADMLNDRVLPF